MPEGHTIHRIAREHNRLLAGRIVRADSPQGRFVDGAGAVSGLVLAKAEANGKHLLHRYVEPAPAPRRRSGGLWLHIHLGLYGKWTHGPMPPPEPRGAVRLRLWTDSDYYELRGATAVELMAQPEVEALRDRLGPDPLRPDGDPHVAWARIARSRVAVGALLMDQSVLSGIGNVYRAEILFRHGVPPRLPGRELDEPTWKAMWLDLQTLMRAGVRSGRIVTTEPADRDRKRRGMPDPEDAHYVYRRTGLPCRRCGTEIRTEVLVERNLYWCPTCQA